MNNLDGAIWVFLGLILVVAWFVPALIEWVGRIAIQTITTAAGVNEAWQKNFPSDQKTS
jgi:hypothetical protein